MSQVSFVHRIAVLVACIQQRLPTWWNRWHEPARFIFFGGVNAVLGYGIYVACLAIMNYRAAYSVTVVCSFFFSYYFNAQFVFRRKMTWSTALLYPLVYVMQYLVGLGILYIAVELFHVSTFLAPFFVLVLTVPLTYLANRYLLKRRSPAGSVPNPRWASRHDD
jgi:putative flippase GtrA